MFAMSSSIAPLRTSLRCCSTPRGAKSSSGAGRVTCSSSNTNKTGRSTRLLSQQSGRGVVFFAPGSRRGSASTRNSAITIQSPNDGGSGSGEFGSGAAAAEPTPVMSFTASELAERDAKAGPSVYCVYSIGCTEHTLGVINSTVFRRTTIVYACRGEKCQPCAPAFADFKSQEAKRRMMRRPWKEMKFKEQFEYAFVRVTLTLSGGFVLLGVVASLILSALLFSMGMKEVIFDAFTAWWQYNPVELVASAVGALDRFLLGMVCLVFGLGSYELFLARSNREGEVRDAKLKKLSWLRVSSIDDLEQKVGEIIVAVMVVNLLEMSLHMVGLAKHFCSFWFFCSRHTN
jgi:uncharacterized membrane protein YqhA